MPAWDLSLSRQVEGFRVYGFRGSGVAWANCGGVGLWPFMRDVGPLRAEKCESRQRAIYLACVALSCNFWLLDGRVSNRPGQASSQTASCLCGQEMMLMVAEVAGLDASGITAVRTAPSTPLPRDTQRMPQ